MASLFTPLNTTWLGFDRIFSDLDRMLAAEAVGAAGFPPLNLYKDGDGYSIELAVAGFKKSDIKIEHDRKRGILTVQGEIGGAAQAPPIFQESESRAVVEEARTVVKRGIANRRFSRSFTVADDLEVSSATLEDGLLIIGLKAVLREQDRPLQISIR